MATTAGVPTSRFNALTRLIGNTPLISVHSATSADMASFSPNPNILNLTGSIKDRMALRILQKAYEEGKIAPGYTIAEATCGNTGISFAAIGRIFGHPVKIFMPEWISCERVHLIRSCGRMCEELAASRDDNKKCLSTALIQDEPIQARICLARN